jgi:hypothetical protein
VVAIPVVLRSVVTHDFPAGPASLDLLSISTGDAMALSGRCRVLETYLGLGDRMIRSCKSVPIFQLDDSQSQEIYTPPLTCPTLQGESPQCETISHINSTQRIARHQGLNMMFSVHQITDVGTHNNSALKQYCEPCQLFFSSRTNYLRHCREKHGEERYPCLVCGKSFTRQDYQQRHKCRQRKRLDKRSKRRNEGQEI